MKKSNALFVIGIVFSAIAIILGVFATAFIVKAMTNSSADGWDTSKDDTALCNVATEGVDKCLAHFLVYD